jgi:hypothetical protein
LAASLVLHRLQIRIVGPRLGELTAKGVKLSLDLGSSLARPPKVNHHTIISDLP